MSDNNSFSLFKKSGIACPAVFDAIRNSLCLHVEIKNIRRS